VHQVFLKKTLVVVLWVPDVCLRVLLLHVLLRLVLLRDRRGPVVLRGDALAGQVQMLPRDLSKGFERGQSLVRGREGQVHGVCGLHGARRGLGEGGEVGQLVDLQQGALAVAQRKGGTFLDEVVREAIDAAFGELSSASAGAAASVGKTKMPCASAVVAYLFAARLARVLVAIAGILELGAALEELEDQLVRPPPHVCAAASSGGFGVAEILPKR
jgi:hypothetical protein